MAPLLWVVGLVSKLCNMIVGGSEDESNIYLNQEELLKILEEHTEELPPETESEEYNALATNIFTLRRKDLRQVMDPLNTVPALPSNATVKQMETLIDKTGVDYVPLYSHHDISNIVGLVYPRDVLRASENHRVRDYASPPWFVPETTSIIQILKQFRLNNENVAFILNQQGKVVGLVELIEVLNEIFGKISSPDKQSAAKKEKRLMLIEKTFPGDMTLGEFNAQFKVVLDPDLTLTLSELITQKLGHHPEKGESIYISPFELTVKETTIRDIKKVAVSTRMG
jgi:CBS domain containing-hemolysin-like protein